MSSESFLSSGTPSVTIIIPAFNEALRLERTLSEALEAAEAHLDRFEVVIVNDGSSDETGLIANRLAEGDGRISVIHQPRNLGVGAGYKAGLAASQCDLVTVIPGDNAFEISGVRRLFQSAGKAEIIVSFRSNPNARTLPRRILSKICTFMLRIATHCQLRDGHSLFLWPRAKAQAIEVPSDYRYHLVTLSTLLPEAASYAEVPVSLSPRPDSFSRVFRLPVVARLGTTMTLIMIRNLLRTPKRSPKRIDVAK